MKKLKRYFFLVSALIIGALLMVLGWEQFSNSLKLSREGKTTEGTVVDGEVEIRRKRGTSYYLTVEYDAPGLGSTQKTFDVGSGVYYKAMDARKVTVHYLTEDPSICEVGDKVPTRFGVLLVGFVVFMVGLFIAWYFRSFRKHVSNLCITERHYAAVDARDFKHLDLAYYEEAQAVLETHGYRFLGDREDLTFRKTSGLRIPIRVLISRDGATIAGAYHFRPSWIFRCLGVKSLHGLDLETSFSNGEWLLTNNSESAGKLDSPPGVDSISLVAGTCVETVIESHARRLVSYMNKHPGVEPVRVTTIEEVEREMAKLTKLRGEWRQKTGLTREEMLRISGASPNEKLDFLHDAIAQDCERKKSKVA